MSYNLGIFLNHFHNCGLKKYIAPRVSRFFARRTASLWSLMDSLVELSNPPEWIPTDVVSSVLSFLDGTHFSQDFCNASIVCKQWKKASERESLWKRRSARIRLPQGSKIIQDIRKHSQHLTALNLKCSHAKKTEPRLWTNLLHSLRGSKLEFLRLKIPIKKFEVDLPNLKTLIISQKGLETTFQNLTLSLHKSPNLQKLALICPNTNIDEVDLSKNQQLEYVYIQGPTAKRPVVRSIPDSTTHPNLQAVIHARAFLASKARIDNWKETDDLKRRPFTSMLQADMKSMFSQISVKAATELLPIFLLHFSMFPSELKKSISVIANKLPLFLDEFYAIQNPFHEISFLNYALRSGQHNLAQEIIERRIESLGCRHVAEPTIVEQFSPLELICTNIQFPSQSLNQILSFDPLKSHCPCRTETLAHLMLSPFIKEKPKVKTEKTVIVEEKERPQSEKVQSVTTETIFGKRNANMEGTTVLVKHEDTKRSKSVFHPQIGRSGTNKETIESFMENLKDLGKKRVDQEIDATQWVEECKSPPTVVVCPPEIEETKTVIEDSQKSSTEPQPKKETKEEELTKPTEPIETDPIIEQTSTEEETFPSLSDPQFVQAFTKRFTEVRLELTSNGTSKHIANNKQLDLKTATAVKLTLLLDKGYVPTNDPKLIESLLIYAMQSKNSEIFNTVGNWAKIHYKPIDANTKGTSNLLHFLFVLLPSPKHHPAKYPPVLQKDIFPKMTKGVADMTQTPKLEETKFLLYQLNIDPNTRDSMQNTPLMLALFGKEFDAAIELIKAGAEVNVSSNNEGWNMFHFLFFRLCQYTFDCQKLIELCQLLVSKGADINATTKNGYTPSFLAFTNTQIDVCSKLFECWFTY